MSGRAGGAATYGLVTSAELPALKDPTDDFVIGVIDTGVVSHGGRPHPYLAGHLADGWQNNLDRLAGPSNLSSKDDGHGTFVAGVILNQAPTAKVHISNVLDGATEDNDERVAAAIRDLIHVENLKVVNLSFFGDEESEPTKIGDALEELLACHDDVLVVTAAGNDGTGRSNWPAAFPNPHVISVAAVDETVIRGLLSDIPPRASFSNYGPAVDVYASGVGVLGPRFWYDEESDAEHRAAGWCHWGGTSFAAAGVTGLLAQTMISQEISCLKAWERILPASVSIPGVPQELSRPYLAVPSRR
jgi:subtilisin family serine protease